MGSTSVPLCEPTRLLTWSTSPTRRLPRTYWPFRSPTQRRMPTVGSTAASNPSAPQRRILLSARHQATSLVPSASSEHCRQMHIAQSSVTGWRSLIAGTVLCLASSAHSATTFFDSSEFIGFLLRLSPPTLLRTAHWRRRGFNAKGYSYITSSSKAYTSTQLSMDAFLTPMETLNPIDSANRQVFRRPFTYETPIST